MPALEPADSSLCPLPGGASQRWATGQHQMLHPTLLTQLYERKNKDRGLPGFLFSCHEQAEIQLRVYASKAAPCISQFTFKFLHEEGNIWEVT